MKASGGEGTMERNPDAMPQNLDAMPENLGATPGILASRIGGGGGVKEGEE